jgi:hypothetical protein
MEVTSIDKNYWMGVVDKLNDGKWSNWASHVLACELIDEYYSFVETNLGEAIKHVPIEKIIENTINAYKNVLNQPYCDLIIMSLGKITIPYLLKNINSDNSRIRTGVLSILYELDEGEGKKLAIEMKQNEKSPRLLKLINWIINNSVNRI